MRRQIPKRDLGNAISLEDALSIMVVIFTLFVIFLIPLVNIDKMKLEKAKYDKFWKDRETFLFDYKKIDSKAQYYFSTFDIYEDEVVSAKYWKDVNDIYVEILLQDSSMTIILHNPKKKKFCAIFVEGYQTVSYKFGNIKWSYDEDDWFIYNTKLVYIPDKKLKEWENKYRECIRKHEK